MPTRLDTMLESEEREKGKVKFHIHLVAGGEKRLGEGKYLVREF